MTIDLAPAAPVLPAFPREALRELQAWFLRNDDVDPVLGQGEENLWAEEVISRALSAFDAVQDENTALRARLAEREADADDPMQPFVWTDELPSGYLRFRANPLVRWLLDNGSKTMNDLARVTATHADRRQFAQLIGYSLGGYSELHYVDDAAYQRAQKAAEPLLAARPPRSETAHAGDAMSASCYCKHPTFVGEGEQEHCTTCGCWSERACQEANARKARCAEGKHAFAEHGSRYNLRCVHCGISSLDTKRAPETEPR